MILEKNDIRKAFLGAFAESREVTYQLRYVCPYPHGAKWLPKVEFP